MSVTFFISNAPTKLVNGCEYYGFSPSCFEDNDSVKWENGLPMIEVPAWPECNMANSSFSLVMSLLGREEDWCGNWTVEQQPVIARQIIKYLASDVSNEIELHTEQEVWTTQNGNVSTIHRGMTITHCGYSDARIQSLMQGVLEVLQKASQENRKVCWG